MQNIVLMTGLEPPGPFAAPGPSNLCTITARSTRSVRACLRASSCWKLPVASFQCSAKKAHPAPSSHVAGPLAPPREHARARGAQRRRGAASSTTRRLTSTAWPRSSPAGLWRAPPTSRFTPGLPPTAPTTRGFSHAHAASRRPDIWLPPLHLSRPPPRHPRFPHRPRRRLPAQPFQIGGRRRHAPLALSWAAADREGPTRLNCRAEACRLNSGWRKRL